MSWKTSRSEGVILIGVTLALCLAASPGRSSAQVTRQPTTHVATPPSPQTLQAMVNPLQGRVEKLEQKVKRLEAALESLRLTVKANQQTYAQHKHTVPGFGILSAKAVYPQTPVSVDTQLLFTCPSCSKTSLSGPPQ